MTDDRIKLNFSNIDVKDFIHHSENYKWNFTWKFSGTRYADDAGGYGAPYIDKQELYDLLGDDFITSYFEYDFKDTHAYYMAEDYVNRTLDRLFKVDQEVSEQKADLLNLEAKVKTNEKRYAHASDKYDSLREDLEYLSTEADDIYSSAPKTRSGSIDRRTSAWRRYLNIEERLTDLHRLLLSASSSEEREFTRLTNSQDRYDTAYKNIMDYVNEVNEESTEELDLEGSSIVKEIRDDIIRKAENGQLPLSTQHVKPLTKLRREYANLPPTPRFYASGQFIDGIEIEAEFKKVR